MILNKNFWFGVLIIVFNELVGKKPPLDINDILKFNPLKSLTSDKDKKKKLKDLKINKKLLFLLNHF